MALILNMLLNWMKIAFKIHFHVFRKNFVRVGTRWYIRWPMKWKKIIFWVWKKQLVKLNRKIENVIYSNVLFLVDFVLRDPRQTDEEAPQEELPHRQEIAVLPKPWHSSFLQAQKFIEKNLHSINPAMAEVLSKWHKTIFKYFSIMFEDQTDECFSF